jgi:hypothetical protein
MRALYNRIQSVPTFREAAGWIKFPHAPAIREKRDRDVRAALSAEQVSSLDAWKSRLPTPAITR